MSIRTLAAGTALALAASALAVLPVLPAAAAAATVQGVVRAADGAPISGARVTAYLNTGGGWSSPINVLTAGDGSYSLGLGEGDVRLLFDARDGEHASEFNGGGYQFTKAPKFAIGIGDTVVRNAKLEVGGVVRGRVAEPDGTPVAGVVVNAVVDDLWELPILPTTTDAQGRYRVGGLPPRPITIQAIGDGVDFPNRYWGGAWFAADARTFSPKLGATTSGRDVTLPEAAAVSGTLALGGSPASSGYAFFYQRRADSQLEYVGIAVVSAGSFLGRGLPPRPTVVLFSAASGDWVSEYYDDRFLEKNAAVLDLQPGLTTSGIAGNLQTASTPVSDGGASSLPSEPRIGDVLHVPTEAWPAGSEFEAQWYRNGEVIPGATGMTRKVRAGDLGDVFAVSLTVYKTGYYPVGTSPISAGPVLKALIDPVGSPSVVGSPTVGGKLTAKPGVWMDGVTLSYRWLRDGVPIDAATAKTYTLRKSDTGHLIRIRVTAKLKNHVTETAYSSNVGPVAAGVVIE